MATLLDQLTLELGWDVKKFLEGAKETETVVRRRSDDFERQSKVWTAVFTNLQQTLLKITATFLSLEAAIRGFEATERISRVGTEFSNLSKAIGMSVTQLSMWEQALEKVGGRGAAKEAEAAFSFQAEELTRARTKGGAPPFMSTAGFGYLQRLNMPDWHTYVDANGQPDLDRLNKDLAIALKKYRDPTTGKPLSPSEYTEYLRGFGWPGYAAQEMFRGDVTAQLEATRRTAPTKANEETWRNLNRLWTELYQSARAVGNDLVTFLEEPIQKVLTGLRSIMDFIHRQGWGAMWQELKRQYQEEGFFKFFFQPHVYDDPAHPERGRAVPWHEYLGDKLLGPGLAPNAPPPPGMGKYSDWLGLTGPRTWGSWWQGLQGTPPASAAPGPSPNSLMRSVPPASPPSSGGALMPIPVPPERPATFDERFNAAVPGRQSMLDTITDLPNRASALHAQPEGGWSKTTNNVQTTIGSMTFNSRASDTAMGQAPSSVAKDLSVGQYSIMANNSLE